MSEFGFGRGYQAGLNSALGQQVSEQIVSGLNRRREEDWAQQQHAAQQGMIQAMQMENLRLQQENARLWQESVRLRQDNAEYERFTNWAMNTIDERNASIDDLQRYLNEWQDLALR